LGRHIAVADIAARPHSRIVIAIRGGIPGVGTPGSTSGAVVTIDGGMSARACTF
jgi:hypothetical protein